MNFIFSSNLNRCVCEGLCVCECRVTLCVLCNLYINIYDMCTRTCTNTDMSYLYVYIIDDWAKVFMKFVHCYPVR